jgi:hypothetical protein
MTDANDAVALTDGRKKSHGDYRKVANVAIRIEEVMQEGTNWSALTETQQLTMKMLAHKAARILEGNHRDPDHWRDIGGYGTLEARIIDGSYDK